MCEPSLPGRLICVRCKEGLWVADGLSYLDAERVASRFVSASRDETLGYIGSSFVGACRR